MRGLVGTHMRVLLLQTILKICDMHWCDNQELRMSCVCGAVTICLKIMHYLVKAVIKLKSPERCLEGLWNFKELSGFFHSVIKERSAIHVFFQWRSICSLKFNSVSLHQNTMPCSLLMPFSGVCMCSEHHSTLSDRIIFINLLSCSQWMSVNCCEI